MTPKVNYQSALGRDDPFRVSVERWIGREFPNFSSGKTEDVMAAVVEEFISTKQYRVGPRPNPESLVMMRGVARRFITASEPIPLLIPMAAVKLPFGNGIDLAELSALRVLACLQDRVRRHYRPGLKVTIRMEDLTEETISPDVPGLQSHISRYITELSSLVHVMGWSDWLTLKPESELVLRTNWQGDIAFTVPAMHEYLEGGSSSDITEMGWQNGVSVELRSYLLDRYNTLYPHWSHATQIRAMARYLGAILTRRRLGAVGVDGERLELSWAAPLPDAPENSTRVIYRIAPRDQTSRTGAPWALKGYLRMDESGTSPRLGLIGPKDDTHGLVRGTLTLQTEDGHYATLGADYTLD